MSGFRSYRALVDASEAGQETYSTWRKTPTQVTTIGIWFDLSMSPGNPIPQYYAASPLVAVPLSQSVDYGLRHGGNVSPAGKYLRRIMALSASGTGMPMPMMLLDYLMFYPFIDEGTTDPQPLITSIPLPRYPTGHGVQMMAVSVAGRTGGQQFTVEYTNQDGVGGRVTPAVIENTVSVIGSIVTSNRASANARGPFIPLQAGDTGVRSVESVTMLGADVGLFALVLVKPLADLQIRGVDAPVEVDFLKEFSTAPQIVDDAYLNWICCPAASLSGVALHGDITTAWN